MKVILIIIILVCFALLGYGLSRYYIERKKFFSEFELLISNINSNINFGREKMIDILNKYNSQIKSDNLTKLCENYTAILEKKEYISEDLFCGITILKNEEKQLLQNFFSSLGKFDIYSQSKEIGAYSVKFSELYLQASDDCKKYASLIMKLTLIVGLLVCLLII